MTEQSRLHRATTSRARPSQPVRTFKATQTGTATVGVVAVDAGSNGGVGTGVLGAAGAGTDTRRTVTGVTARGAALRGVGAAGAHPPALQPDGYGTAVHLDNQGTTAAARGDYDEADELLSRAFTLKAQVLGADHPDVAITGTHLAMVARCRGQRERALALYREALAVFEHHGGTTDELVLLCKGNIALLERSVI